MFHVPEQFRITVGDMGSTKESGNNGAFMIPHFKIIDYYFQIIASDGMGWEHVSVVLTGKSKRKLIVIERTPTWQEMCLIKEMFWDDDDTVIQYHPAKEEYVNNHPYCLHLWKPKETSIPIPDKGMVGI